MQQLITRFSYWLGLASVAIALLMRAFNAFGYWLPGRVVEGVTIWYMSFYKGALLFLLVPIAAASYDHIKESQPLGSRPPRAHAGLSR